MTISSSALRVEYAGNGSTTDFATGFRFLQNADLVVVQVNATTGAETTLTLDTDYTVTGAGDPGGGTVSMASPPSAEHRLVITNDTEIRQDVDYVENDPFPAEVHEEALDRLTLIARRSRDEVERAIRLPTGDTGFSAEDMQLPSKADRVGKYLLFDENGATSVGALPTSLSGTDGDLVVDTLAVLRTVTPTAGAGAVVLRGDLSDTNGTGGGLFRAVTGASAGTYTDNAVSVIVPAGGDGSAAWLRISAAAISVASYTELKALAAGTSAAQVLGRASIGDGGQGLFLWHSGDQSANVTNDPGAGVWVPPDSDATGASGAWRRSVAGHKYPVQWWGADPSAADASTELQAAIDYWVARLEDRETAVLVWDDTFTVTSGLLAEFTNTVVAGGVWDMRGGKLVSNLSASGTTLEFRVRALVRGISVYDLFVDGSANDTSTVKVDGGDVTATPKQYAFNWNLYAPRVEKAPNKAMHWVGNFFESALWSPHLICTSQAAGTYALHMEITGGNSPSSMDIFGGSFRGGQHCLFSDIGDIKVFGGTYIETGEECIYLQNVTGGGLTGVHVENGWYSNSASDQAGIRMTNVGHIRDCTGVSNNGNMDTVAKVFAAPEGIEVSRLMGLGAVTKRLIVDPGSGEVRCDGVLRSKTNISDLATERNVRFRNTGKVLRNAAASGNVTFSMDDADVYDATLTGNLTINDPTDSVAGDILHLVLKQDGTGGHGLTLGAQFVSATSFSSTANSYTTYTFYFTGGAWVELGAAGFS